MIIHEWVDLVLNEGINDKGIFKSVMLGGTPGSGKSYTILKIKSGSIEPRIVNTDKLTEKFMKQDKNYSWEKYGDKTKMLTKELLVHYLNGLMPLWVDGTSANPNSLMRRKGILESIGYDIGMVFVNTDLDVCLERNRKRERVVDEDFLIATYNKIQALKPYYSAQFNPFVEIKNNEGELTDNVVLSAFKKTYSFFTEPIKNPIGVSLKEELIEMKGKYLVDHSYYDMAYINKLVNSWYRD